MASRKISVFTQHWSENRYDKNGKIKMVGCASMTRDELLKYQLGKKKKRKHMYTTKLYQWYKRHYLQWYREYILLPYLVLKRKTITKLETPLSRLSLYLDNVRGKTYKPGWDYMTKKRRMEQLWNAHRRFSYGTDWLLDAILDYKLEKQYLETELYF